MNFLKENAFVVITAGVLLLCSAVALVWANSASGTADGYAVVRTKLSEDVKAQALRPVNEKVVDKAKADVQRMRGHRQQVAMEFRRRSDVYRVMQFTEKYLGAGQTADAFPIRDDLYEGRGMRKQFPARYLESFDSLLAALNPTRPPTAEEILDELDRTKAKMGVVTPRAPGVAPELGPELLDGPFGPFGPRRRTRAPGGAAADDTKKEKTPQEMARENRVVFQAQAGHIYAERGSLDTRLMTDFDYGDVELWLAQVNRWVHQDILRAIRETNELAQKQASPKEARGVSRSAIRRLVSTRFRGYVCNKQAAALGGGRSTIDEGGPRRETPVADVALTGGQAAANLIYVDAAVRRMGPRLDVAGRRGGGGVPMLTGRVTNQLYDVVHYQFTVVASAPDLLKLYEKLLQLNYHTILEVSAAKASRSAVAVAAERREGAMAMGRGAAQDLYHYGLGSVVAATIVGELLIMADRTRGRWDDQANDWDKRYPPLMPAAFLKRLAGADLSALREADKTRMTR